MDSGDDLALRAMTKRPETCPHRPIWTLKPVTPIKPLGRGSPLACKLPYNLFGGVEGFSSSAGGKGDRRPRPNYSCSGERGPASKGEKQHLGRKREMALLSFVVGVHGGELPLSIEFGALARGLVRPQHTQRRLSTFAGWEAGARGSGRQLNSVGEFLPSNGRGGKQPFKLSDDVGRKTK